MLLIQIANHPRGFLPPCEIYTERVSKSSLRTRKILIRFSKLALEVVYC